jgi:serine phosphatase RsbU (regulator of sigma subunit)
MERVTRDLQRRLDRLDRRPFHYLRAQQGRKPTTPPTELYARILRSMGEMAPVVESLEFPVAPGAMPIPALPPPGPRPPAGPPPQIGSAKQGRIPSAVDLVIPAEPVGEAASTGGMGGGESVVVYLKGLETSLASLEAQALVARLEWEKNRTILRCESSMAAAAASPPAGGGVHADSAQIRKTVEEARRASAEVAAKLREAAREKAAEWEKKAAAGAVGRQTELAGKTGGTMEIVVPPSDRPETRGAGASGPIKAQIKAEEILRRIWEQSGPEHGEIQFAVDKTGNLHTPRPEQAVRLLEITRRGQGGGGVVGGYCPDDWIMAQVLEPLSGTTFGIARPIGESLREMKFTALRNLGIGFLFIALALLGVFPLSARMTRNLSTLTKRVGQLAEGDLAARVPVRSKDEFGMLAAAFNRMAAELGEHQKALVEQERLQKEIEMCRRIQEVMLPSEPLSVGFLEAKGVSIPAREVGGDFFNYFVLPEGDIGVLMGDVSGKGVPAALLMANLQARLQTRLQVQRDLAKLAAEVDLEIGRQTEPHIFATIFVGIIDRDGRSLRWVSAGHNPQFVLGADGRVQSLPATGRPVGLMPGESYEECRIELRRGDFLFLYTDGLVEAANGEGEEFGAERLERLLQEQRDQSLSQIVVAVVEAVKVHRAGAEAGDDATLLGLRVS